MQSFRTKMSPLVLLLTIVIHLVSVVAGVSAFRQLPLMMALPVLFVLLGVLVPPFLLRPFRYDLEGTDLVIRKHWLRRRVPLASIRTVSEVSYAELKITLRLWASGGLWGWFGIFLSGRHGRLTLQCTELKHLVLVTLDQGKKIVFSPEDPAAFVSALQEHGAGPGPGGPGS